MALTAAAVAGCRECAPPGLGLARTKRRRCLRRASFARACALAYGKAGRADAEPQQPAQPDASAFMQSGQQYAGIAHSGKLESLAGASESGQDVNCGASEAGSCVPDEEQHGATAVRSELREDPRPEATKESAACAATGGFGEAASNLDRGPLCWSCASRLSCASLEICGFCAKKGMALQYDLLEETRHYSHLSNQDNPLDVVYDAVELLGDGGGWVHVRDVLEEAGLPESVTYEALVNWKEMGVIDSAWGDSGRDFFVRLLE